MRIKRIAAAVPEPAMPATLSPAQVLALRTSIAAAWHASRLDEANRMQAELHAHYLAGSDCA